MHFEHLYNNDLSSSSEVNESKEHTHSLDTPYCECEFQDPLYVLGMSIVQIIKFITI